jgi:hypothetical protein
MRINYIANHFFDRNDRVHVTRFAIKKIANEKKEKNIRIDRNDSQEFLYSSQKGGTNNLSIPNLY